MKDGLSEAWDQIAKVAALTGEQKALVLAAARELDKTGIDFLLIAGKDSEAAVVSNMCTRCAMDLLGAALAGAMAKADQEGAERAALH